MDEEIKHRTARCKSSLVLELSICRPRDTNLVNIIRPMGNALAGVFYLFLAGCQASNTGASNPTSAASINAGTHEAVSTVAPAQSGLLGGSTGNMLCHLDLVSGSPITDSQATARHGRGLALEGWAQMNGKALSSLLIAFKSSSGVNYSVRPNLGVPREDVANAFNDPSLKNAGFAVTSDITALPNGSYELWLRGTTPASSSTCDLKVKLTVQGGGAV